MDRQAAIATYRAGFGVLTFAAIATQLVDLSGKGTLNLVSYFSYFTIQSNLIAATVLIVGAARWRDPHSTTFDLVRGGAVVYMSITGIVFTLLLSGTDVDTAIPWVNTVVHQLMPIVLVVDWLLDPPTANLTFRQGILWLIYPLVLDHLHPHPGRVRRAVSVPIPRSRQRWLRQRGHLLRGSFLMALVMQPPSGLQRWPGQDCSLRRLRRRPDDIH